VRSGSLVLAWLLLASAGAARADVDVRLAGPISPIGLNTQFAVNIVADISNPVLGWGLDLDFDPSLLQLIEPPLVGPDSPATICCSRCFTSRPRRSGSRS